MYGERALYVVFSPLDKSPTAANFPNSHRLVRSPGPLNFAMLVLTEQIKSGQPLLLQFANRIRKEGQQSGSPSYLLLKDIRLNVR